MLKMGLLDCAIKQKCCSVQGGRGNPIPGDLTAQESPSPGICHPRQKKKIAKARGSSQEGGGLGTAGIGGRGWTQLELTDA